MKLYSRREQYEALRRLILSTGVGLVARVRDGEAMPLLGDLLVRLQEDFIGDIGHDCLLLTRREIDACILRYFIAAPQPGFRELARYYLHV